MPDVFDGLADEMIDAFGEAVDYTPAGGVLRRIRAIWLETPLVIQLENADVDGGKTALSVRAADLAAPTEGDIASRVKTGRTMKVTTPILPDGNGLIVCNLERPA